MSENTTVTNGVAAKPPTAFCKRRLAAPAFPAAAETQRSKRSALRAAMSAATATAMPKPPSKSALVLKLLARTRGATITEIQEPTGWQPHSTRAFLSGLRKKGMTITREQRRTGETAYRTGGAGGVGATPCAPPPSDELAQTEESCVGAIANGDAVTEPAAGTEVVANTAAAPEVIA